MYRSLAEHVLSAVLVNPNGCWDWTGALDRHGYGKLAHRGRDLLAHRAAYEAFVGDLTSGLTIDHLCRSTACVNPWHMEQVPIWTNVSRGRGPSAANARKTECVNGHAFTPDNTMLRGGHRQCRVCRRLEKKAYRDRKRSSLYPRSDVGLHGTVAHGAPA